MTVRRLEGGIGDIVTSGVQFISEKDEIAQTITTRLKLFLGEYFRDEDEGTDWFGRVMGKDQPEGRAESEIKRRIFQTEGVYRVLNLVTDLDIDTRQYSFNCQVITVFGAIELSLSEPV